MSETKRKGQAAFDRIVQLMGGGAQGSQLVADLKKWLQSLRHSNTQLRKDAEDAAEKIRVRDKKIAEFDKVQYRNESEIKRLKDELQSATRAAKAATNELDKLLALVEGSHKIRLTGISSNDSKRLMREVINEFPVAPKSFTNVKDERFHIGKMYIFAAQEIMTTSDMNKHDIYRLGLFALIWIKIYGAVGICNVSTYDEFATSSRDFEKLLDWGKGRLWNGGKDDVFKEGFTTETIGESEEPSS